MQQFNFPMPSIEYLLISLGITAHFVMKWGWSQVRLPALIGFSISFYTLSSPINLWIPFYCSLVCHFVGPRIITKKTISKCWLLSGVVLIALPLIFFKYLGRSHILLLPYSLEMLTLPLGISFFTFQAISYLIDLSRGQLTKCHSLSHLILYILYFPKIIAGPIERQNSFSKQIQLNTDINYTKFRSGLWLIAVGLFKKKALADRFFPVVDEIIRNPNNWSFVPLYFCLILARYQIFFDFSGYTDIARGVSRILGIELMKNFNMPFTATNIADYWRRWHISLSTWIRDYLFFPLALSCRKKWQIWLAVMFSFCILGLWHGAHLNFLIYGLIQGILICTYELFRPYLERIRPPQNRHWKRSLYMSLAWVVTFFVCICLPVVFFWLQDTEMATSFYAKLWESLREKRFLNPISQPKSNSFILFVFCLVVFEGLQRRHLKYPLDRWLNSRPFFLRWAIYWTFLILFFLLADTGKPISFSYSHF